MEKPNYNITKYACFTTCASTAISVTLSPMLFTTFHRDFGISYTLLGFLVVLNYAAQLTLDLIYSFFSGKLNLKLSAKLTPALISLGLLFYALAPYLFPAHPYIGLAAGTVVFSAGSGLSEVLLNPIITSLPSDDPEKLLSRLHTCYAWGLISVVGFSAAFIYIFGGENWQTLALILALLPCTAFLLMLFAPFPEVHTQENITASGGILRNRTAILFIICIFFAGASELTMCQWCSGYLETVFGIDKLLCDLLGLALFGVTLGIGRTLYTRFGKKIDNTLIFGSIGATFCYLIAAVSPSPVVGLISCALTGFFVSMLWPGSLIAVTERIPDGGVSLFALMAVGGDLGATFYPQLVGAITDSIMANRRIVELGADIGLNAEQVGMKAGMIFATLAPLAGTILFSVVLKKKTNDK